MVNWATVVRQSLNGICRAGDAVKAQAAVGLALVAAHPVAAAVTVVAIVGVGVAIYYYTESDEKKKEDDLKYSSGKDDDLKRECGYFYDPVTKSITDTPTTDSSFRKREVAGRSSSTTEKNNPKTSDDKKSNLSVSEESYAETTGNNQNTDNKFLPDTDMSGEKKVEEFITNISEAHSTGSSVECFESYDAYKLHSLENLDENSSISSFGSISFPWSDVSSADLTGGCSSIISDSSIGTVLSGDYDSCQACDENNPNPVNTHNEPCHHRYLCDDCARRIIKLFKRCKVCRSRIEAIVLD